MRRLPKHITCINCGVMFYDTLQENAEFQNPSEDHEKGKGLCRFCTGDPEHVNHWQNKITLKTRQHYISRFRQVRDIVSKKSPEYAYMFDKVSVIRKIMMVSVYTDKGEIF